MSIPTVCIIDSGIGGLSILQEIEKLSSPVSYVYCADKKYFPYGGLPSDILVERVSYLAEWLFKKRPFDILVVACNTASTVVLPYLRSKFNFPVVGVVPAIKPGCLISSTKYVALLATEATINRSYTDDLIREFSNQTVVFKIGSNDLVRIAEDKILFGVIDEKSIAKILKPIINNKKIDTLVLACTHFPFLIPELISILGPKVKLVDSGTAIAKRVTDILGKISYCNRAPRGRSKLDFISTENISDYKGLSNHLNLQLDVNFLDFCVSD